MTAETSPLEIIRTMCGSMVRANLPLPIQLTLPPVTYERLVEDVGARAVFASRDSFADTLILHLDYGTVTVYKS